MKTLAALLLLAAPAFAQFDQIKRVTGRFHVELLKSHAPTGSSGLGEPLYDVEVVVRQGGRVLYEYKTPSHGPDSVAPGYFADDFLELRDVTGDGVPEVLFHTGFQYATGSLANEHVLHYDPRHRRMTEIGHKEFSNSGTHGFRWLTVGKRVLGVVAVRNWPASVAEEDRCHYCLSPFRYTLYEWNAGAGAFTVRRQVDGRGQFEMAGEALDAEWGLIRQLELKPR